MKRIKKVMFILSKTLLISCLTACSTQGNITPSNEGEENIESPPPATNDVEAYHAMEQVVEDGKIRSIGLSNWYIEELEEFLPQVTITPAVVQNEIHPYYQEKDVIPYIQNLGIVVNGYSPFGGRGHTSELFGDEVISSIAATHNVTSAQVILRWNLQ